MNPKKTPYQKMLEQGKIRNQHALKMQVEQHLSLREIGERLGVSKQRAAKMIAAAVQEKYQ